MRKIYSLLLIGLLLTQLLAAQNGSQAPNSSPPEATQPASLQQPVDSSNFTSAKGFVLEDGTPVRLRINRTISSEDSKQGDTVDFEVLQDISVNGTLVIQKGGIA